MGQRGTAVFNTLLRKHMIVKKEISALSTERTLQLGYTVFQTSTQIYTTVNL